MRPCQVHGSEDCDCTPRNERPSGITSEQRKKLLEAMKSSVGTFSWETRDQINRIDKIFFAGAEALARILHEEVSDSDEYAAHEFCTDLDYGYKYDASVEAFLAGCNRYRPIVEEMLAAIKNAKEMRRVGYGLLGDVELIARAEKMLGDKK